FLDRGKSLFFILFTLIFKIPDSGTYFNWTSTTLSMPPYGLRMWMKNDVLLSLGNLAQSQIQEVLQNPSLMIEHEFGNMLMMSRSTSLLLNLAPEIEKIHMSPHDIICHACADEVGSFLVFEPIVIITKRYSTFLL
ncbi:hypothetical protein ACJX0J_030192, partial [Zea mays]